MCDTFVDPKIFAELKIFSRHGHYDLLHWSYASFQFIFWLTLTLLVIIMIPLTNFHPIVDLFRWVILFISHRRNRDIVQGYTRKTVRYNLEQYTNRTR